MPYKALKALFSENLSFFENKAPVGGAGPVDLGAPMGNSGVLKHAFDEDLSMIQGVAPRPPPSMVMVHPPFDKDLYIGP